MEKARLKRQFIYYAGTFLIVLVAVILYAVWIERSEAIPLSETLSQIWFMPILVLGLQFGYESILSSLNKRTQPSKSEENYIQHISMVARQLLGLTISDIETLKVNQVFQLALSEAYKRYQEKIKKEEDYLIILEWFELGTLEHSVVELTIKETIFLLDKENR
jgi:hypothetical protein